MFNTKTLLVISILSMTYFSASTNYSVTEVGLVRSVQCFDYFVPILHSILNEFASSYQNCSVNEENQSDDSYQRHESPNFKSKQNSKIISIASIEQDSGLHEDYYEIERCQNASQRAFVENTAMSYKKLHICLTSAYSPLPTTTELTSTVDNKPETNTLPPTTQKTEETTTGAPGSNSVTKIKVSSLLLAFNIWKFIFHSRYS